MNEVFEKLSDVFEELRSEADEREYSIQTEETKKADKELNGLSTLFQTNFFRLFFRYCTGV